MRLFKAVQIYGPLGDGKSGYLPAVREIIVIKETTRQYLVEANLASGHRSRISKDDLTVAVTEVEAWDKYISRAKRVLASMKIEYACQCASIAHALDMRGVAVSNEPVKIGGSD